MELRQTGDISDHPLIRFLAYGVDRPQFTKTDATNAIWDESFASEWTPDNIWDWVARGTVYDILGQGTQTLKPEAIFAYLDYVELQEARESSRKSMKVAIWAILISGVIGVGSLSATLYQIFSGC